MKEEFGPKVFFPDRTCQSFSYSSQVGSTIISLVVAGRPSHQPQRPRSPKRIQLPDFRTLPSKKLQVPSSSGTYSLRVKRADAIMMPNGKNTLKPATGQTYILVDVDTANVEYINCEVQRIWGPEYIIVTADGLPIEPSSGTEGTLQTPKICYLRSAFVLSASAKHHALSNPPVPNSAV